MSRAASCLVALLLAAGLIAGCGGDDDDGPDLTETANFEVDLPDGWSSADDETLQQVGSQGISATEGETGSAINSSGLDFLAVFESDVTEGDFRANVNVFREKIGSIGPERYLEFSYGQLKGIGAEISEKGDGPSVGGEPSELVEYQTEFQGSGPYRVKTLTVFRDGYAYNITLTALPDQYDEVSTAFDQIISSWSWTD